MVVVEFFCRPIHVDPFTTSTLMNGVSMVSLFDELSDNINSK